MIFRACGDIGFCANDEGHAGMSLLHVASDYVVRVASETGIDENDFCTGTNTIEIYHVDDWNDGNGDPPVASDQHAAVSLDDTLNRAVMMLRRARTGGNFEEAYWRLPYDGRHGNPILRATEAHTCANGKECKSTGVIAVDDAYTGDTYPELTDGARDLYCMPCANAMTEQQTAAVRAGDISPGMRDDRGGRFDMIVERMKEEITEDVASGRVPNFVTTFAQLHDYVDANCYGGFCNDYEFSMLSTFFGGDGDSAPDAMVEFMNEAQTAVDAWLRTESLIEISHLTW